MVVSAPELKTFLLATPFFGGLPDPSLDLLISMLVERRFDAGATVVAEGEPGRSMFIVKSGRLAVSKRANSGSVIPISILELGDFFGIFDGGQLVAIAGERLRLPGFTEVSAVATHPDHRGRGYAKALISVVMESMAARGDRAFLHVWPDNAGAIATYTALGFSPRRLMLVAMLRRLESA